MATTLSEVFKNTADAIRSKTGKTEKIKPVNFAKEIESISVGSGNSSGIVFDYSYTDYMIPNYEFYEWLVIVEMEVPEGVIRIGDCAFGWCENLRKVKIPDSVTSIGSGAFSGCSSLTSVNIPDGVTNIGSNTFNACSSLTSIKIPDSVTSIDSYAFYECSSLTSIVIPDKVTSISHDVFYNCSSLTSVVIGDSVRSIGEDAFSNCSSLTSITVGENNASYKDIDGNLYTKDGATLIQYAIGKTDTSFIIPDSVTSIGSDAFYNCSSLTSIVIPDKVTYMGPSAFCECESLYKVKLPDILTGLSDSLFDNCFNLTEINFPSHCEIIGECTFYNCSNLKEVILPDSVKYIYYDAFYNCCGITTLVVPENVISYSAFVNCAPSYMTIPTTVISDFNKMLLQISLKELTVRGGGEVLGLPGDENMYANRFQAMTCLEKLTIGDNITKVPSTQFAGCTSLKEIIVGENVEWIGEATFAYCVLLRRIDCSKCKQIPRLSHMPFSHVSLNQDLQIKVPAGKLNEWQDAWGADLKDLMVEEFTNTPDLELESYDLSEFQWTFTDTFACAGIPLNTPTPEFEVVEFDVEFIQGYDYVACNKLKFDGTTLYYGFEHYGYMPVYNVMEGWYMNGFECLMFDKPVSKEFFEWLIKRAYVSLWR